MPKFLVSYVVSKSDGVEKEEKDEESAVTAVLNDLATQYPGMEMDVLDVEEVT